MSRDAAINPKLEHIISMADLQRIDTRSKGFPSIVVPKLPPVKLGLSGLKMPPLAKLSPVVFPSEPATSPCGPVSLLPLLSVTPRTPVALSLSLRFCLSSLARRTSSCNAEADCVL